jgi:hypothetical protein
MGIHRSLFRLVAVAGIVMLAWSPLGAWQGIAREGTPGPSTTSHQATQLTTQQPFSPAPGLPERVYPVDAYFPGNDVWVAIPPVIAGTDLSGTAVRVYVTPHRAGLDGWTDGAGLKDCSGGFETTMLQSGTSADNYVLAWGGASVLGRYDVIVDLQPFGVYNAGRDIIDHARIGGFQVLDGRAVDYAMISPARGCARIIGNQSYVGGLYEPTEEFLLQTWDNGLNGIPEEGLGDDIFQGTIAATWELLNFVDHNGNPIDVDLVGRMAPNTGVYVARNATGEGDVHATAFGGYDETAFVMSSAPSWVP